MTPRFSQNLLSLFLFSAIALAACDAPADESAATEQGTAISGSLDDESPAGEGVTAEELPHSDVPPPSREVFTDAECDFEEWVGKPVDEAGVKATGRPYRIMTPESMMTMDHNPERINVIHDDGKKVTRVWCG